MTFHGVQWPYYPRTGIGVSGYGVDRQLVTSGSNDRRTRRDVEARASTPAAGAHAAARDADLRATATSSCRRRPRSSPTRISRSTQPQPGIVDADDVWVRIGQWRKWDLMLGRFEAFEIYHRGMGLDINTQERLGAFDR